MPGLKHQKRFTVALDRADHDALLSLGNSVNPPVNLQYLLRLAVRNLLDQHAAKQLAFPLDNS